MCSSPNSNKKRYRPIPMSCLTRGNLQTPDPTSLACIQRGHSTQAPRRRRCSQQSPVALSKNRSMSTSDAGDVEPSRGSDLRDLSVQCLNGEGYMVKLNGSCTGWEVYQIISKQLPRQKGARLTLHHLDSPLMLHKELQAQDIIGKAATLSCTFVPTDLYAAWFLSKVCQSLRKSLHYRE